MFLMTFPMFNKFLTREEFSVLFFGRGDAEDFKLKGFDFAARSVAAMSDTVLVFMGAPHRKNIGTTHRPHRKNILNLPRAYCVEYPA